MTIPAMTFTEIGQKMGVSRQRAWKLYQSAMNKLAGSAENDDRLQIAIEFLNLSRCGREVPGGDSRGARANAAAP